VVRASYGEPVQTFRPLANEIETARLLLRPWSPSDCVVVRELWKKETRARYISSTQLGGHPWKICACSLKTNSQSRCKPAWLLAIETKHDNEFIGYCGLIVGAATLQEPEIAYELFRRVHGNGYATEAARAILSAAQNTGRTRLWATVRAWNISSFRVLEKIGFVRSGKVDLDAERGDSIWMTWPGTLDDSF
jgi:RimJ/RimL family protein N-acetyltransferase